MNVKEFIKLMEKSKKWDHNINYQENRLLYPYTLGFDGMYTCNPYKDKFLKIWKFTSKSSARESAKNIYDEFLIHLNNEDFIGCDMARKYLQAGYQKEVIKKECRVFFENFYFKLTKDIRYQKLKEDFLKEQKSCRKS